MRVYTETIYVLAFYPLSGDIMKTWKVFVLCIFIGLIATPAVSAEEEYAENSDTEDVPASAGIEYIVSPWTENSLDTENSDFPSTVNPVHKLGADYNSQCKRRLRSRLS